MDDPTSLIVTEQRQVAFYDDQIVAARVENGKVYVPIRPICRLIGLNWAGQRQRIHRDEILSTVSGECAIHSPKGGSQKMLCLPLDYLNGWLFKIDANRVNPNIKQRLLQYQKSCYQVLFEAFQAGSLSTGNNDIDDIIAIDPEAVEALRIAESVVRLARSHVRLLRQVQSHESRLDALEAELGNPDRFITVSQAAQLSDAVRSIGLVFSKVTGRNEYGGVYGELHRRFGINSYLRLPVAKFDDAMNWLRQWYGELSDSSDVPF